MALTHEQAAGRRARGVTAGLCRAALALVVLALIAGAYAPFGWDPPRTVHNQVTRDADGALRFGDMNRAITTGPPAWLPAARSSGRVRIQLQADPQSGQERASMLLLGSNFWNVAFAVVQERSDLFVWLRRPGSDLSGDPPFIVRGVISAQHWISVDVLLQGSQIRIGVDGRTRLTAPIPADSPRSWPAGQIALGDEVHGGVPWQGEIRLAEVQTQGHAVNYVRPGTLSIPATYWYLPDHIEPFPPTSTKQWLLAFVDLLTFLPFGFLVVWSRRPPLHPAWATVCSAGLAVLLAAGKFLFHQRHTSAANVALQIAGGLIGALVAWYLARTGRGAAWLRPPGR